VTLTELISLLSGLATLLLVVWVGLRLLRRRRTGGLGPSLVGAFYELQSKDKREAMALIVEQRAEEKRPEYPDGNLPDLEQPPPEGKE
jgi:hypothetical protein